MTTHVGLIGVGAMGEAVLAGLLNSGYAPHDIVVVEARPERREELTATYDVAPTADIENIAVCDVVMLVVKPADIEKTVQVIHPHLRADAVVVSMAAGVRLATLAATLGADAKIVRVMPNTPALVGQGMSVMSPSASCTDDDRRVVAGVLEPIGQVLTVNEADQDAVTAVSGSGPAYAFYLAEAMVEAGCQMGLPADIAHQLTAQTLLGAATMLMTSPDSPTTLREKVTSPGGTTHAAITTMDDHGVRDSIVSALIAAQARSIEMGKT